MMLKKKFMRDRKLGGRKPFCPISELFMLFIFASSMEFDREVFIEFFMRFVLLKLIKKVFFISTLHALSNINLSITIIPF